MKLRHCRNLTSTPDFTRITNLEELILEGCVNLVKVHPSFGMLKKLIVLNMRDCKRFRRFPCKVEMNSLEVLHLFGCSKLDKLPEFFSTLHTLKKFFFDGTAITELPSFVYAQRNLQVLEFGRREKKRSGWWTSWLPSKRQRTQSLIMPSLADLCFLRILNLSYCNISEVSDSIGGLSCLQSLSLNGNNFTSLPRCLSQLSRLKRLYVCHCKRLEVLPETPPSIRLLFANGCTSLYQPPANHDYNIPSSLAMVRDGCRNQISFFLEYMKFPSNTHGIFGGQDRQFCDCLLDIAYHGNIIPQWFTNRSTRNHIKVELPPNFCYNKVRGYGICVVLTRKNSCGRISCDGPLLYSVNNFDGTSLHRNRAIVYGYTLIYKSDIILYRFTNKGNQGWVKAKKFVTFSFKADRDFEVKECGVKLIFDEDIQGEETGLNIPQDLSTPTHGGGYVYISNSPRCTGCSW